MNWNFGAGFFSPHNLSRAGLVAGAGLGASALAPQDAEGAVYSKDGRRLLNLLDNASKGALPTNEPLFEFQERLPKQVFANAKANGGDLKTRHLAATRNNIQHYWNERHSHMSNEQIEDLVESLVTGQQRFYVKANEPYAQSIAVLGPEKTGVRGSLAPAGNYTFLHQVNPLSNKRLLKMKSLSETPDGSAVHPLAHISSGERPTQQAISADGISKINIADFSVPAKVKLPTAAIGTGIGAGLTLAPGEALGWGPGGLRTAELRPGEYGADRTGELHPSDIGGNITGDLRFSGALPSAENMNSFTAQAGDLVRQAGLGARGVLEGLGAGLTLGLSDPGRGLADLAGLPSPKNSTEQERVDLNRTFAELAGTGLLGAGLAKAPGAAVSSIGRGLSSDPVSDALLTLADKNFDSMLDYGNKIMDRMESYGLDLDDE